MATWYLGKISYQREDEAGSLKTVSEQYLIDAVSYTEAEARLFEIVASNIPDFTLVSLNKKKIAEIIYQEGFDVWYRAKVKYITFDEKTQKEKKVPYVMMINSSGVKYAYDSLVQHLGNLLDYEITDINITSILEIHPYSPENELLKNGKFVPVSEATELQ